MPESDIRITQSVAGDVLQRYGYELAELPPASATDRLRGSALAAKYVTFQAGRRVLQTAGVMHPH